MADGFLCPKGHPLTDASFLEAGQVMFCDGCDAYFMVTGTNDQVDLESE